MTIGTYLKELTARVAKGDELAKLLGYEGRSSLQKLLNPEYDTPLSSAVAKRFLRLEGKGSPPVRREEILAVCDLPAEAKASSDLDFATATASAVARIASEGPLTEATIQSFDEIIRKVDQLRKQQPDLDQGHIETAIRALILQHQTPAP